MGVSAMFNVALLSLLAANFGLGFFFPIACRKTSFDSLRMMASRHTYIPVVLPAKKQQKKTTLLVRSDEKEILDTIASWLLRGKDSIDDAKVDTWMAMGLAFPLSDEGTIAIHDTEVQHIAETQRKQKLNMRSKYAADIYLQTQSGDDTLYVKASSNPSVLRQVQSDVTPVNMDDFIRRGEVFTNVSKLLVDEQMVDRVNSIATRLHKDFPMTSPEWKRWTDRTSLYNATSLTQVMAIYFQEQSIGDVGGKNADYVPKRGYPGTLAPGEKFTDNYALEELPHKVLHPWPAMQQIQFHVRYPPNHPMIPPPILWFGLNNMYTENLTEYHRTHPSDEIVGGASMNPKDAIQIAHFGRLGMSYDPLEQIEHGGMLFPGGVQVPFYHPDHGPTVSAEQAMPPVPPHLAPIIERWPDPMSGLNAPVIKSPTEEAEIEDELLEEEVRKYAMEALFKSAPAQGPAIPTEAEDAKRRVEDELTEALLMRSYALRPPDEWDDIEDKKPIDPEALAALMSVPTKERDVARKLTEMVHGTTIGRRETINLLIHNFRDLQDEILKGEREAAIRKNRGKKRSRRKSIEDDEDEDLDVELDSGIDEDTDADADVVEEVEVEEDIIPQ